MDQQIAITGRGGQGVLFLTRILAECALEMGLPVIASETHGMAQRGGSVISTVKVGAFRGPLIRAGQADIMLVLDEGALEPFIHLLAPKGNLFLNAPQSESHPIIDATGLAAGLGAPLIANLVLLGFALRQKKLFFDYSVAETVVGKNSPARFRDDNLKALNLGYTDSKS